MAGSLRPAYRAQRDAGHRTGPRPGLDRLWQQKKVKTNPQGCCKRGFARAPESESHESRKDRGCQRAVTERPGSQHRKESGEFRGESARAESGDPTSAKGGRKRSRAGAAKEGARVYLTLEPLAGKGPEGWEVNRFSARST